MTWRCDTCEEVVASDPDGWVEWLRTGDGDYVSGSLRLVHAAPASPRPRPCQYDEHLEYRQRRLFVADCSLVSLRSGGAAAACASLVSAGTWSEADGSKMAVRIAGGDRHSGS